MEKAFHVKYYFEENKDKALKYKKFEALKVIKIDKKYAYPIAITKNQLGETVKIGVSFLKRDYIKSDSDIFVLENSPTVSMLKVQDFVSFVGSDGTRVNLRPDDFIVKDENGRFSGISKEDLQNHYILATKFRRLQRKFLKPSKKSKELFE